MMAMAGSAWRNERPGADTSRHHRRLRRQRADRLRGRAKPAAGVHRADQGRGRGAGAVRDRGAGRALSRGWRCAQRCRSGRAWSISAATARWCWAAAPPPSSRFICRRRTAFGWVAALIASAVVGGPMRPWRRWAKSSPGFRCWCRAGCSAIRPRGCAAIWCCFRCATRPMSGPPPIRSQSARAWRG